MPTGQVEPGVWERRINAKAEKGNGHLEAETRLPDKEW
jgi:hypothetical protein